MRLGNQHHPVRERRVCAMGGLMHVVAWWVAGEGGCRLACMQKRAAWPPLLVRFTFLFAPYAWAPTSSLPFRCAGARPIVTSFNHLAPDVDRMRTYEAACAQARGQRGAQASAAVTPLARRGPGSSQRLQLECLYDTSHDDMDVDGGGEGAAGGAAAPAAAMQEPVGGGMWAVAGSVFEHVPAVWAQLWADLESRNAVREGERLIKVSAGMRL